MKKQVAQFEKDDHSKANGQSEKLEGKKTSFVMPSQMDNAKQNPNFVMPSQVAQARRNPNFVMPSAKPQAPQHPIQKKEESSETALPEEIQMGMESMSGMDLSDVNVHYNSSKPAQLQALAYAQGTDIHVASGQEKHLAHEAWHVVQQKQGRVQPTTQTNGVPVNDSPALEKEADVMGAKATSGKWDAVQMKKNVNISGKAVSQLTESGEKREALAQSLMSEIAYGNLCSSDAFDKITYENWHTGQGTAKKRIMSQLEWFENNFPAIVGSNASNIISDYASTNNQYFYLEAHRRGALMQTSVESWIGERSGDSSREKREIGMMYFVPVITDFMANAREGLPSVFGGTEKQQKAQADQAEGAIEEDEEIKKMKLHYEQRSAKSVFTKMSWLANTLAPTKNSEGELEVEVKIPVACDGAVFLGGKLGIKVEREENSIKIGCKAGLIVGGEVKFLNLFKLSAQVGFGAYFESKAADTDKAMTLISYGFYKRLKENSVLGRFADSAWGGAFSAAKFAATTEREILSAPSGEDDAPYIEVGGYGEAKAEAKLNTGIAEAGISAEAEHKRGKRYDKDTIATGKGKNVNSTNVKVGLEGSVGGFTIGGEYEYSRSGEEGKQSESEHCLEISAKTPSLGYFKVAIIEVFRWVYQKLQNIQSTNSRSNDRSMQANLSTEWAGLMGNDVIGYTEDQFGSLEKGMKSEGKLGVVISVNFTKKEASISFASFSETEIEAGIGAAGLSAKLEKRANLLVLEYAGGWKVKSSFSR